MIASFLLFEFKLMSKRQNMKNEQEERKKIKKRKKERIPVGLGG